MGSGADGKPATAPPLKVSTIGKDGTANGDDVVAAKAKHMNQLMDPLADEKKLLIDFKSLLAQAPMGFGATGGFLPAWMKGKKPAMATKPTMKTVSPLPHLLTLRLTIIPSDGQEAALKVAIPLSSDAWTHSGPFMARRHPPQAVLSPPVFCVPPQLA